MHQDTQTIIEIYESRGSEVYGSEAVTQLQHALQSAVLAEEANAPDTQVVAALLHDIGHIMSEEQLPPSDAMNLDDQHETRAYDWLCARYGAVIADPVRLHVPAKRYLCTIEPDYINALSPTSHKSFLDQGGVMNTQEKGNFESEPHFQEAVALRKWDDLAKDTNRKTPSIQDYADLLDRVHL